MQAFRVIQGGQANRSAKPRVTFMRDGVTFVVPVADAAAAETLIIKLATKHGIHASVH